MLLCFERKSIKLIHAEEKLDKGEKKMFQQIRPNQRNQRQQRNGERAILDEEIDELMREMVSILLIELITLAILVMIVWILNTTNIIEAGSRMFDKLTPLISITLGGEFFRVNYKS